MDAKEIAQDYLGCPGKFLPEVLKFPAEQLESQG